MNKLHLMLRNLLELKLQNRRGKLKNYKQISDLRRDIARLKFSAEVKK